MFDFEATQIDGVALIKLGIGKAAGLAAYQVAKFFGPLFPLLVITLWWLPRRGEY